MVTSGVQREPFVISRESVVCPRDMPSAYPALPIMIVQVRNSVKRENAKLYLNRVRNARIALNVRRALSVMKAVVLSVALMAYTIVPLAIIVPLILIVSLLLSEPVVEILPLNQQMTAHFPSPLH